MTIDILGTKYAIKYVDGDDARLTNEKGQRCGAMIQYYNQTILISNDLDMDIYDRQQNNQIIMDFLRHEIVHGYFKESGLTEYGYDETLVDWVGMMLPKIIKTVEQAKMSLPKK